MEEKKISTEYITLGQFLKFANIIETGGREKEFLKTNPMSKEVREKFNISSATLFKFTKSIGYHFIPSYKRRK